MINKSDKIKVKYKDYIGMYYDEKTNPSPNIVFHNIVIKKDKKIIYHKCFCENQYGNIDEIKLYEIIRNIITQKENKGETLCN